MIGELLGHGCFRQVWAWERDPQRYVVKTPRRGKPEAAWMNLWEWDYWHQAPESVRRWLVPPVLVCEAGLWLLMPRGQVLTRLQDVPVDHPVMFRDTKKPKNWVRLDGRTLLCDYAHPRFMHELQL